MLFVMGLVWLQGLVAIAGLMVLLTLSIVWPTSVHGSGTIDIRGIARGSLFSCSTLFVIELFNMLDDQMLARDLDRGGFTFKAVILTTEILGKATVIYTAALQVLIWIIPPILFLSIFRKSYVIPSLIGFAMWGGALFLTEAYFLWLKSPSAGFPIPPRYTEQYVTELALVFLAFLLAFPLNAKKKINWLSTHSSRSRKW